MSTTPNMSTPLLEVRDLSVALNTAQGRFEALRSINLSLCAGETLVLLGESGCGKSLTSLALMQLLPSGGEITAGSVQLHGQELTQLSETAMRSQRGAQIAMIFQEPGSALNPVLTIGTQLIESLTLHRQLRGDAARQEAESLLRAVGISAPAERLAQYPFELSGGMKQRVMIAMALAGNPQILLADEPTTALDVTIQAQILTLLQSLQQARGMSMLLITHDLGVAAQVADRIAVMYAGEIVEVADRASFFAAPSHPYSRALLAALPQGRGTPLQILAGQVPSLHTTLSGCRFANRCALSTQHCQDNAPAWQALATTHQVRCHTPLREAYQTGHIDATAEAPTADTANPPLLSVTDLKVHFPIRRGLLKRHTHFIRAVDGVTLSLAAGETLALVGESGCGKSTLGRALMGLTEHQAGRIELAQQTLNNGNSSAWQAARKKVQIVFQDPFASLNPRLRINAILAEAMPSGLKAAELNAASAALLEQVGLSAEALERYPHEFSGGQRQRIALARALAVKPQMLICDEPTSALDVSVQAQILQLLGELQKSHQLAYLFITHNLAVVEYLADRIAVMYLGKIVEYGPADRILQAPQHPYTQALLAAAPKLDGSQQLTALPGDPPSPAAPPKGCAFHPRCPQAEARCHVETPILAPSSAGQQVACHRIHSVA